MNMYSIWLSIPDKPLLLCDMVQRLAENETNFRVVFAYVNEPHRSENCSVHFQNTWPGSDPTEPNFQKAHRLFPRHSLYIYDECRIH